MDGAFITGPKILNIFLEGGAFCGMLGIHLGEGGDGAYRGSLKVVVVKDGHGVCIY